MSDKIEIIPAQAPGGQGEGIPGNENEWAIK